MKTPYLKLQSIPDLPTRKARRPSAKDLLDHPDLDDVLEIMADSLLAGMASLQGATWDPLLIDTYPEAFSPAPGRCVWTWQNVIQVDPDAVDLNPILNLSLRPSDSLPEVLRSVTPRFCKLLTGMRNAELSRALNWLHDQGVLPTRSSQHDIGRAHAKQGYGAMIDAKLDLTDLLYQEEAEQAPRNSRLTQEQHYSLKGAPPDATLPMATLQVPPGPADLLPELHRRFLQAADFLRDRARDAVPKEHNAEVLEYVRVRPLNHFMPEVCDRFLRGTWDTFRMSDPQLSTPDKVACALLRAMIQVDWYRPFHFQSALGGAILAGISPASVVRSALDMLKRTSLSYLDESHIQNMIDIIRTLPKAKSPQAQANREELVAELNDLLFEFVQARDDLNASLVDDVWRASRSGAIPAWGLMGQLD